VRKSSALYESPVYDDPSFPIVFHRDAMNEKRPSVYANWHKGIEVLYCVSGSGQLLVNAETIPFAAGDILAIDSNALHSLSATGRCDYYCMIVEPEALARYGLPTEKSISSRVERPDLAFLYQTIIAEMEAQRPFYKCAVMGFVLCLFAELYRMRVSAEKDAASHISTAAYEGLLQALSYIRTHFREKISIDTLCRNVGMSKYYFCRTFKRYTGFSPIRYINTLKCNHARKLLISGVANVSEAALAVGIENLSYFSRLYRNIIGSSPSDDALFKERRRKAADRLFSEK
jgi:AraC-like DNA-binding protein